MAFTKEDAASFFEANKSHVNRLRKTIANLVTMQHVRYYFQKLQEIGSDASPAITKEQVMGAEALTTTIVISYGRLFAESDGARVFNRNQIPELLRLTHDEIVSLRNERYAHHGNHGTTASEIELFVAEKDVEIKLHWYSSLYDGAAPHWGELFSWVSDFLKISITKQLDYLSKTSGKDWLHLNLEMEIEDIAVAKPDDLF